MTVVKPSSEGTTRRLARAALEPIALKHMRHLQGLCILRQRSKLNSCSRQSAYAHGELSSQTHAFTERFALQTSRLHYILSHGQHLNIPASASHFLVGRSLVGNVGVIHQGFSDLKNPNAFCGFRFPVSCQGSAVLTDSFSMQFRFRDACSKHSTLWSTRVDMPTEASEWQQRVAPCSRPEFATRATP